MRTTHLSLLVIFCCLSVLTNKNEAGQAEQLRRLLKSQRFSSSLHYDSGPDQFVSSETPLPVYKSPQDGKMEADKVQELPGQPEGVDFDQYSGYVTVDPNNGRALFYYFVESPTNSSSKPLVLWLNGGPGCSSLGAGAMMELGPFRVNSDNETLQRNYYAWNEVANVIFLESPAGVGFSYSNTSSDYDKSGDKPTAEDNYTFLVNWLERFPQYKTRAFFIAGESYAGHYIPELAYKILQNNKITNSTIINLKGIAIGNGYVDVFAREIGDAEFFWGHALISDDMYALINSNCNFTSGVISDKCLSTIDDAIDGVGTLDQYNIYAPLCSYDISTKADTIQMGSIDPCIGYYTYSYLNNLVVQKALHANVTMLPYSWSICSEVIRGRWTGHADSMLPIFKQLLNSGINVWLYSGDIDGVIPTTSTRYFIKMLGLSVKNSWRPWYHNNEVGGYVEEYNGLTLVTVRGAGHMVPSDQPERALTMISSFLQGQLPPSS